MQIFKVLMDRTVSVTRPADDGLGSGDLAYSTVASGLRAYVRRDTFSVPSGVTANVGADVTVTLSDPTGSTITGGVRLGDRVYDAAAGETYEVLHAHRRSNAMIGRGTLWRLECRQVYFT